MSLTRVSSEPKQVAVVEPGSLTSETPLERSFEDMYKRMLPRGIAHAKYLVPREVARDVVHEASLQLWNSWENLTVEQRTEEYFLAVVTHRAVDYLRREKKYEDDVELTPELEESLDFPRIEVAPDSLEFDEAGLIDRLIERMPVQRRAVWLLVMQHGFTYQAVAEQLGLKYPTVGRHMALAKEFLRKGLTRAGLRLSSETITALLPRTTAEATDE